MRRRRPPGRLPGLTSIARRLRFARRLRPLFLLPLLPLPGAAAPAAHDLHIAYADLALEAGVVAGRIRMFTDDLERALGPLARADAVSLRPGAEADALVRRYLADRLRITLGGVPLEPEILRSGQDMLDREPVWEVVVRFAPAADPPAAATHAATPTAELRIRNTLLFELFDDQRNVVKVMKFPEQTQRTFYFAPGEEEHVVRF